ncbi:hypothetical protein KP509_23G058200 [Ceratopteris richardii]|uniref:Uncharacterized protein n=1 Tax=Ceratopteris richardii TaxID=49495 RepID=A0A8T2S065_CERRI|nr:hypothetical protein KP509_23G058200 [Ceratopteris richardii]
MCIFSCTCSLREKTNSEVARRPGQCLGNLKTPCTYLPCCEKLGTDERCSSCSLHIISTTISSFQDCFFKSFLNANSFLLRTSLLWQGRLTSRQFLKGSLNRKLRAEYSLIIKR